MSKRLSLTTRIRTVLAAAGLAGVVAGCGAVPGDGPIVVGFASNDPRLPFDLIDLRPDTVSPYRAATIVDRPSAVRRNFPSGGYPVAPGDILKVRVFEAYEGNVFPVISRAGSDLGNQRVLDNGTITVPYVGVVQVAGLSLEAIEARILELAKKRAQDPQVVVERAADRTHTFTVSGDVKAAGRFSLLQDARSVLDAIALAGGTQGAAHEKEVVLRRNGEVAARVHLIDLLAGSDIAVQRGDDIVVRNNPLQFTVLGAVAKAGNIPIDRPALNLMEALASAGGLVDERANRTGVFVFRQGEAAVNPSARPKVFQLDLLQPVSVFVAQQFGVLPSDVIYVTNAPLHEYNKVIAALYRSLAVFSVSRGAAVSSTF
ncbi:MAG: hypothetical protein FJX02_11940 [Alphaproteobacteria bacterium]|nr:hypothetical protein [Alphaproteobacteria bacterium]